MGKLFRRLAAIFLKPVSFIFPIKKNRVLFRTIGGNYSCNPKYISEYILKNCKDDFELVWIISPECDTAYFDRNNIKYCSKIGIKYFIYFFTSKFIIVNHNYPEFIPKKKSQRLINTWHGGGSYKRLIDNHTTPEEYRNVDKFISSCRTFSELNLIQDFYIDPQKIFEIGMPRNDIFFENNAELSHSIKRQLGIDDNKKIILYAPTFRAFHCKKNIGDDFKKIVSACNERFGGEFVVVNRDHHFSLDNIISENDSAVYEASKISDTQQLILSADVVISDYSSIIWDTSIAKKPCFIYAYDLEEYYKTWDFYVPIEQWPFPVGKTIDEMVQNIRSFDEAQYNDAVKNHHKQLGSFENGTACRQVVEYMEKCINKNE